MKNLFAVISMLLCLALSSYAGPGRPIFSSRSSYSGGFRSSSSPSYRSFSTTPSRTYNLRSTPSTSTYSRPAAAPRSYSYTSSAPVVARPVSRSTTERTTVVNNHYHGDGGHSGGGGISAGDLLMYHALTSHNNSPTYVNTQPVAAGPAYAQPVVASEAYQDGPAVIYQQESHFWSGVLWFAFGMCCLYGVYRLFKYLLADV